MYVCGSGGITSRIPNPGSRWEASGQLHASASLLSGKSTRYALTRKLEVPEQLRTLWRREKIFCSCRESKYDSSLVQPISLVTTPTELSQFQLTYEWSSSHNLLYTYSEFLLVLHTHIYTALSGMSVNDCSTCNVQDSRRARKWEAKLPNDMWSAVTSESVWLFRGTYLNQTSVCFQFSNRI
jgi:hypothetical protein